MDNRNQEEIADIQQRVNDGENVKAMVATDGWAQVIEPHLQAKREAFVSQLISAPDYKTTRHLQHAISGIDDLLGVISSVIQDGEEAQELIAQENIK